MSDAIKHECGVAVIRLKKDLQHYKDKYGMTAWGLNKLYLLMEKQRNRGQDGVGMGVVKLNTEPGTQYMNRLRHAGPGSLDALWGEIHGDLEKLIDENPSITAEELKQQCPWVGESYIGHLRYGTHGDNTVHVCHPMVRTSNWPTRRLMIAGNFNLTNTPKIFNRLYELGQHPVSSTDTMVVLEKIAHFLDEANNYLVHKVKQNGAVGKEITKQVSEELDMAIVLNRAAKNFDGGFFQCGVLGHGVIFALRDRSGVRPGYYYEDDEVIACASESGALVTTFGVAPSAVKEVPAGHAILIAQDGTHEIKRILPEAEKRACVFERIYFSRGNDSEIYQERKKLGAELVPAICNVLGHDIKHTVFSFVPNTAESSFLGMIEALDAYLAKKHEKEILKLVETNSFTQEKLQEILSETVRNDKAVLKDAKLRTFISDDTNRKGLVAHAYDITRKILRRGEDNLVMIDDSIVRGTTLRESLLRILMQLNPKKIVIASSAPQIRYPDCYGIDMSELGRFIAFEACVELIKENGKEKVLQSVYEKCKKSLEDKTCETINYVKEVYSLFSAIQISNKIAEMIRPEGEDWNGEIKVVYQTIEGMHKAIPDHTGDWCFTGNYPTKGGFTVVNKAFINYMENKKGRSY